MTNSLYTATNINTIKLLTMKLKHILYFAIVFLSIPACSKQSPTTPEGSWLGMLPFEGTGLDIHIIFNIEKKDSAYTVVMHDPDNMSLANKATINIGDSIRIQTEKLGITFSGKQTSDSIIEGVYYQMGHRQALQLKKQNKALTFNRPQTPGRENKNYRQELEFIANPKAKGVELNGIFSRPLEGEKFSVAILIHGSGQLDMDETIADHKIFYVISDYLAKRGIAVFRYDKRGVGSSLGNYAVATSEDFASDVEAIIDYLKTRKDVDPNKIGLIGHSEGGIIAFMLGAKRKDISYIVSMAGTGISGKELFATQREHLSKVLNLSDSIRAKNKELIERIEKITETVPYDSIMKNLNHYVDLLLEDNDRKDELKRDGMTKSICSMALPWRIFINDYDPTENLKKIACPVFAINGEKDAQVFADRNLSSIDSLVREGGNKDVTVKKYPDLNHLFQHCKTGNMSEYAWIEETISPEVLDDIGNWIEKRTK